MSFCLRGVSYILHGYNKDRDALLGSGCLMHGLKGFCQERAAASLPAGSNLPFHRQRSPDSWNTATQHGHVTAAIAATEIGVLSRADSFTIQRTFLPCF
eukprot:4985367-Pleurochrysis_carterae.AAC.3